VPIMVHPAKELNRDAFAETFWVMTIDNLKLLRENVVKFYASLVEIPFDNLTGEIIASKLQSNCLDTDNLQKNYLTKVS
jgi:hypothetical protein